VLAGFSYGGAAGLINIPESRCRTIVHLAEVAKIVSRDKNYSVRATPTRTRGELAILIHAFNEMLAQIQESEKALRKAHDGLEQRVQERTASSKLPRKRSKPSLNPSSARKRKLNVQANLRINSYPR